MVSMLLENHGDVNLKTVLGSTPLHIAARSAHVDRRRCDLPDVCFILLKESVRACACVSVLLCVCRTHWSMENLRVQASLPVLVSSSNFRSHCTGFSSVCVPFVCPGV